MIALKAACPLHCTERLAFGVAVMYFTCQAAVATASVEEPGSWWVAGGSGWAWVTGVLLPCVFPHWLSCHARYKLPGAKEVTCADKSSK